MIARPVSSALACGSCRHAILKAIVSRSASGLQASSAQRAARQTTQHRAPSRGFSAGNALRSEPSSSSQVPAYTRTRTEAEPEADQDPQGDDDYQGTPWFLQEEPPRHPPIQHAVDLPKVPEDAPTFLQPMMKYIYEDMGLDDLSLLDLRDLDPPAALGPNLMMLFGTARSERHLHVSSSRFVRWLKRNHKINARADGLIGPGELRTKLRRLRKKAKLLGTNSSMLPGGDNGISTGWVCVNFATDEGGAGETESFDESGRLSGFGAPTTGTTVVVQVMTEARRNELDLETLWQSLLRRNLEELERIKGNAAVDRSKVDGLVASKIQLPGSSSAQQWEALKRASQQQQQQQRLFSTSARRTRTQGESAAAAQTAPEDAGDDMPDLATLGQQIAEVQLTGTSVGQDVLQGLILAALHARPYDESSAVERLAMVDRLCLMAHERGMAVLATDWLVAMIEAIVSSPAYGPELRRAQHNLETILTDRRSRLAPEQVLRLMAAHAQRQDWDRFWDVFRVPPRFQEPRGPELYELAFRATAATGDRRLCIDALRWVYPEMTREVSPVWPVGALYSALRACILVADPAAEQLLRNPPNPETLGTLEQMRLKNREFVRVLREVESLRGQRAAAVAEEQRAQTLSQLQKPGPVST
ncbi:ATPase synthesis protein 25 [Escovopsis weberi]|uniref:ATPase synthesis protein 25 n=1 Tax=Escovopsis weberi TaxID=150374 RepID=A0A0M8N6D3_ESCWE|nr:ATPase synthesis protein 25 [Escovopsis weberi]